MKKVFGSIVIVIISLSLTITAQTADKSDWKGGYPEGCTSITVGKDASFDGSVITSHTDDSHRTRSWIDIVPAKKHQKGEEVIMYKRVKNDSLAMPAYGHKEIGRIPQVKNTNGYINTAYPSLNDKQLGIGESTFGGRDELQSDEGLIDCQRLCLLMLERESTARGAIETAGILLEKYGWNDYGECITIADKNEVWQLEIMGEGPDNIGSVWAAQRIPDDHVGISANICRIAEIDLDNKDYFMASENVFKVAKKMDFWDGKETFKFWEAYAGRKPFSIREYYVLSSLAPALGLKYEDEELPFSVKPEKKVDVRDVMKFYRTTYDGTQWEMIRNLKVNVELKDENDSTYTDTIISPAAHPWMTRDKRKLLNTLEPEIVERYRPIAVQYCAYSWIVQLRDWLPDEVGGRLWFGLDVPRESPRIPIYAGNLSLPGSFSICGQDHFSQESAMWAFRRANRLATVNWGKGKEIIEPLVMEFENKAFDEIDFIENKALELLKQDEENAEKGIESNLGREFLTRYSNDFARAAVSRWWELGDELWVKFRWSF